MAVLYSKMLFWGWICLGTLKGNFAHDPSATGLPAMLACILTTRSGTSHFQKKCMVSLF